MKDFNLPYSREFGFVETLSWWPVTHMVAPKDDALGCADCHAQQGRLAGLDGVYLPGRDNNRWLDLIGVLLVLGTLAGVIGHGLIRKLTNKRGPH